MQTYFPSQVVTFLDERFPFAKEQAEGKVDPSAKVGVREGAGAIGHLINMIDGIPSHLLRFQGTAEAEIGQTLAALRMAKDIWATGRMDHYLEPLPSFNGVHPLAVVRKHIGGLSDNAVDAGIDRLSFVADADLKKGLARDLVEANSALDRGAWKSATVVAGSVVEALLLDVLMTRRQADATAFAAAEGRHGGKFSGRRLDEWDLHHLTEVAQALAIVAGDTATSCGLIKNFRNLIHPGRALRLAHTCDRGSALSAIGAMEHVLRDLSR